MENNEVNEILNDLGLDEEEVKSVNKRNKLLNETTAAEVLEIVNFFKIKCKIDKEDMARIVIKNPFILNESFARIDLLTDIYDKIGFSEEEYKKYITSFDKAFSLNPQEVVDNVSKLIESGKDMKDIKRLMIEKSNQIFS